MSSEVYRSCFLSADVNLRFWGVPNRHAVSVGPVARVGIELGRTGRHRQFLEARVGVDVVLDGGPTGDFDSWSAGWQPATLPSLGFGAGTVW